MRITLSVIAGPHRGREFSFEEHSSFVAGRSRTCQFRLPQKDQFFSRVHFMIELNPPLCRILDLGSANGTFVNGRPIQVTALNEGDVIEAGDTLIRVMINRAGNGTATPVDSSPFEPTILGPFVPESPSVVAGSTELLPQDYREKIDLRTQPIPGYLLVEELGQGGMGVVYLAIRESDQSVVALKTLRPAAAIDDVEFQRFQREAMILRSLDHPHIIRFRDVGESGELLYFAMDYVPGIDAQKLLRQLGKPLPVRRAVRLACQLLTALEHAHANGYVHRDIKPSNLLVQQRNGDDFVWLADFGLARTYQSSRMSGLTLTGDVGGTTPFMPPEQILSFRDSPPAVDQYAAAATLYKLLTRFNIYNFPKEVAQQLLMILSDPIVPIDHRRSDLPADLVQAIHRALSREPADRFPDVAGFRHALEPFAE